jgi:hypothetical protein
MKRRGHSMLNIQLTDEQVFSIIEQLPKEKKLELLDHLQFDQWLESEEAMEFKAESEKAIQEGRTMSMEEVREKLRKNGKDL